MLKNRLLPWVALSCWLLFSGLAHPQPTEASSSSASAWLRQFPVYVGGTAYAPKNQDNAESGFSAEDVLISLSSPGSHCRTQLVRFSNGSEFGTGFVVSFEKSDLHRNQPRTDYGQQCDLEAKAAVRAVTAAWPECDDNRKNEEVRYLVQKGARAPTCLFVIPDRLLVNRLPAVGSPPSIDVGFAYPTRIRELDSLADVFLSAPWPRSMADAGFRPCNSYVTSTAGYARRDSGRDPNSIESARNLAHPALRWAFYYFVKLEVGRRCGDGVRYRIDPVDTVLAYLSDGTVLLKGRQSVLRVRLEDGISLANAQVQRVEPERFIDDMRSDGGKDCVESGASYGEERCKWLLSQGWYAYFASQQKSPKWNPEKDTTYYKKWYQGFDAAVEKIFFSNRE